MRSLLLAAAAALLLGCPAAKSAKAAEPPAEPTPAARAAQTRQRLQTEPLRWTARHSTQADYEVYVENQHTPRGWRRQLRTIDNGREALVIDLVEKNGVWHVLEPKHLAGVYRPFEVPLEPASHLDLLHRARLRFVDEEQRPWSMEGGTLVAREKLPTAKDAPERQALLERGAEWEADPKTGWLLHERFAELDLVFSDFRWEEDPALSVPQDLTGSPPSATEAPMLIARCHGTDFRLPCEADTLIIDPANPRLERRVPARGMSIPIAILDDRQRVIVLRRDMRGQQPVLVELASGSETPLGGDALAWQFTSRAYLDEEKSQLLVEVVPALGSEDERLLMIDLAKPEQVALEAKGSVHAAGDLSPGVGFSLQEGRILLAGPHWHGAVGKAEAAVVVSDGLLLLRDARTWFLMTADGKRRRFGDGFRGDAAPAISPDATEAYFVRKEGFRFVAESASLANPKKKHRIPLPLGRYERPVWR